MQRRFGNPKTEQERKITHKARFGNSKLPPRGTGRQRYAEMLKKIPKKKRALGQGGRFALIKARAKAGGARNPAAVAAIAGRRAHGQAAMTRWAVAGRKRK